MQNNGRWAGPGCGAKHVRAITAGHVERARAVAQRADTAASLTSAQRIQEDSLAPVSCNTAPSPAAPLSRRPAAHLPPQAALLPLSPPDKASQRTTRPALGRALAASLASPVLPPANPCPKADFR